MNKVGCKDLYLSAYIKSKGIPIEHVARKGKHFIFYFKESDTIRNLIDEYVKDTASINVKAFRNALRDLKSLASGDIPIPETETFHHEKNL